MAGRKQRDRLGLGVDGSWVAEARAELFDAAGQETDYLCAELSSGRLLVRTDDHREGRELFVTGGHPDSRSLDRAVSTIQQLLGDGAITGGTFLDLGAGSGAVTIAALLTHPFARALAVEDGDVLTLRMNLVLNGVEDRTEVTTFALIGSGSLEAQRVALLRISDSVDLDSVRELVSALIGAGAPVMTQRGRAESLADLWGDHDADVDVLALDEEGPDVLVISRISGSP
jgi:hypothetical protein